MSHRSRAQQHAEKSERDRLYSERLYRGLSHFPMIDPSGAFSCVIQSDESAKPIPIGAIVQKVIICTLIQNPNQWDDKKAAAVAGALQKPHGNELKPPVVHEVRRYIEKQYQKHSKIPAPDRDAESIYWNTILYNVPEWKLYADSFVPGTKVFHEKKPYLNLIRVPNSTQYLQPSERLHHDRITHGPIENTYEILYITPETSGKPPLSVGPYGQRLIICMIVHLSWNLKDAFDPLMALLKKPTNSFWFPVVVGEMARYIQIQSQNPRTTQESDHWNTILHNDRVWRDHVKEFDNKKKKFRYETPPMWMTHGPNTGRIVEEPSPKDRKAIVAPRLPASAPPPAASNSGYATSLYVNTDQQSRQSATHVSRTQPRNPTSYSDRQYATLLPKTSTPPQMRQSSDQQGHSTRSSTSTEDSLSRMSLGGKDIPRTGPGRTRIVCSDVEQEKFDEAVRKYPGSRLTSEDVDDRGRPHPVATSRMSIGRQDIHRTGPGRTRIARNAVEQERFDEAVRNFNYPDSDSASEDVDERGTTHPVVTISRRTERSPSLYPYMSLEAAREYRENPLNREDIDRNPTTNLPARAIDSGISQSKAPGYIWYAEKPRTPGPVSDDVRRSPVPAASPLGYPTEPRSRSHSRSRLSVPASVHPRRSPGGSREQTADNMNQYINFSPMPASREPSSAPRGANRESSLHTTAHSKHPRDPSKSSTPESTHSRHDDLRTLEQRGDRDEQRKSSGHSRRSEHSRREDNTARHRRHQEKKARHDD